MTYSHFGLTKAIIWLPKPLYGYQSHYNALGHTKLTYTLDQHIHLMCPYMTWFILFLDSAADQAFPVTNTYSGVNIIF